MLPAYYANRWYVIYFIFYMMFGLFFLFAVLLATIF